MHVELIPHPDFPHPRIRVQATIHRHRADLTLRYFVLDLSGDALDSLRIPDRLPDPFGSRRDGLWKTTCFEAFVKDEHSRDYCEINISPSGEWAAYLFDSYREGMREGPDIDGPYSDIFVSRNALALETGATYDLSAVSALPKNGIWRLNLSAVIEETDGTKSYWALKHPADKPDFHHPDGFVLELPPAI